jgi:prepilin-type N-terminal cleavage/methylation domain-containing protein
MKKAFTLIELLIVVAIIAILAAIAVPNFLEAQTRAKISRGKADVRSLATAIEAYAVDYNGYPPCNNEMLAGSRPDNSQDQANPFETRVLERLSTPVAYITAGIMPDPFRPNQRAKDYSSGSPQGATHETITENRQLVEAIKYSAIKMDAGIGGGFVDVIGAMTGENAKPVMWMAFFAGPDRTYDAIGSLLTQTDPAVISSQFYDPTNGTVSYGEIWRAGGTIPGGVGTFGKEFFPQLRANQK